MTKTKRIMAAILAISAAAAAVVVVATPSTAINPCTSVAQMRYDIDDVKYQDPALGCVYMAVQYAYQPPTTGLFYIAYARSNLAPGVWYDTPNNAQIVKTRACTGEYCNSYGLWSGWWTTTSVVTFG